MAHDGGRAAVLGCGRWAFRIAIFTLALAERGKGKLSDASDKARFIRDMNHAYLALSLPLSLLVIVASHNRIGEIQAPIAAWADLDTIGALARLALCWYLLSRCTEVLCSFLRDAFEKLDCERRPSSSLRWFERVRLALNSYLELLLNFGLIYAMMPAWIWPEKGHFENTTDAFWHSVNVITTSGGSGFTTSHWIGQVASTYEIACGLILLVVCFTIYVGHGIAEFAPGWNRAVERHETACVAPINENRGSAPGSPLP